MSFGIFEIAFFFNACEGLAPIRHLKLSYPSMSSGCNYLPLCHPHHLFNFYWCVKMKLPLLILLPAARFGSGLSPARGHGRMARWRMGWQWTATNSSMHTQKARGHDAAAHKQVVDGDPAGRVWADGERWRTWRDGRAAARVLRRRAGMAQRRAEVVDDEQWQGARVGGRKAWRDGGWWDTVAYGRGR
jgi:hypothetical protein